jgi:hypothetical protein
VRGDLSRPPERVKISRVPAMRRPTARPIPESQTNTGLTCPFVPAVCRGRVAATTGTRPLIPWMVVVVAGMVVVDAVKRVTPGPSVVAPTGSVDATERVVGVPGRVVPVTLVDETGTDVDRGRVTSVVRWGTVVREIWDGAPALAPAQGTARNIPNAPAPMRNARAATTIIRLVTIPVWRTGPYS